MEASARWRHVLSMAAAACPRRIVLVALVSQLVFWAAVPAASAASPIPLVVPQSTAFVVLGHSCGGIQEQAFATGFTSTRAYPVGDVYLRTSCSTGGRGSPPAVYTAWLRVIWNFAANVASYTELTSAPADLNPTFSATNVYGVNIYNDANRAYMAVPPPAAPAALGASQVEDSFQVGWTPAAGTAPLVTSTTITATPTTSTTPVLTARVGGSSTSGLIGPLQPSTTYRIVVVSNDAGGSSPASTPISLTSEPATVPPSAPTGLSVHWTIPGAPGDMLAAKWSAAVPGNSPVTKYAVAATIHDGDTTGLVTTTVSGSTLSAVLAAADISDWSVKVRAHNRAGWGPWSAAVVLYASG